MLNNQGAATPLVLHYIRNPVIMSENVFFFFSDLPSNEFGADDKLIMVNNYHNYFDSGRFFVADHEDAFLTSYLYLFVILYNMLMLQIMMQDLKVRIQTTRLQRNVKNKARS